MAHRATLPLLVLAIAALAVAASADGRPAGSGSLGPVAKEHNVDAGGGAGAVRLTVPAEARNLKGATVACVVFFYDPQGCPIRSLLPSFAGADGSLRAPSSDTPVDSDEFGTSYSFLVPYGAFPQRKGGKYLVTAQARLVLRGAACNVLLAQSSTTFYVE